MGRCIGKPKNMERKSVHDFDYVFSKMPEYGLNPLKSERVDFDGDMIYPDSLRYYTFSKDNCTCVKCGLKASFFAKERYPGSLQGTYHFNLYGVNENGEEVLFTKDHIFPKSKWPKFKKGKNHLSNLQTMCGPCNWAKGNKVKQGSETNESRLCRVV